MDNKGQLLNGYKFIGIKKGVCGGEPTILGTRLKPEQIVAYGSIQESMEDFQLTKEQVLECYRYMEEINIK